MREKWARRIVLFTGLMVLLLATVFARIQNPAQPADTIEKQSAEIIALDSERIQNGRRIYLQQDCSQCHSIAGDGNPRIPLDGVGATYTADELRNRIIGADTLKGIMPEGVRKKKRGYAELPNGDLNTLVIYMQSLRQ